MAIPNTRTTLKEYCLRNLGKPVIDINVDDDQVEDRLDEALQYFAQYHTDGVERMYLKYKVTADEYETTLTIVDPTADHTVYMPNATGYLPLLNAASTTVITATPAELNYVDGVTSAIQTQLDTKGNATKAFAIAQAVALG